MKAPQPIPVAAWYKAWVRGRSLAVIAGSNPAGGMDVCLSIMLSSRGLCDGLITRPEESYRVWCVWVWSWSFDDKDALVHWWLLRHWKKNKYLTLNMLRHILNSSLIFLIIKLFSVLMSFYSMAQQPLVSHGHLIMEVSATCISQSLT
jgi:hypothetical protein